MSILVYVENTEGKFKKSAYEAVSYAKAIAEQSGSDLIALSVGNVEDGELSQLGTYGASKVLNVNTEQLKSFVNQAYAAIIVDAARSQNATVVVLSNSFSGKGLAPRVAAKLNAALADGAIEVPTVAGDNLQVKTLTNKVITKFLQNDLKNYKYDKKNTIKCLN